MTDESVYNLARTPSERHANVKPTCGRCQRSFDPADARFDGAAQHRDTAWCRRCVDLCHESSDAGHRCPICA